MVSILRLKFLFDPKKQVLKWLDIKFQTILSWT